MNENDPRLEHLMDENNFIGAESYDDGVINASPTVNNVINEEQKNNDEKTKNEERLEEIKYRMNEIIEKANNSTSGFSLAADGETKVLSDDLLEYNTLLNLSEILKDTTIDENNPNVVIDGLTIKENKRLDYYRALGILDGIALRKKDVNEIEEIKSIDDENNDISDKFEEALENSEKLALPSPEPEKVDNDNIISGSNDISDKFKEALENSEKLALPSPEPEKTNATDLIPGTNIPRPRKKGNEESYEDYEAYLKEHYKPYGIGTEETEYYPGTEIPKPRNVYPHEISNNGLDTDPYYNDMLNYFADKYTPKKQPDPTPEPTEVKGVRKATEFLKKHKKKIIVAVGLTALAAAFVPGVAPSIMYANSVLYGHVPSAIGSILHGCNSILSVLAGATEISTGLWAIGGVPLNAGAAAGSLLNALGVSALTFVGSASILGTINIAKEKIVNMWNKHKEKKQQKKDKEKEPEKINEIEKTDNEASKNNEKETELEPEKTVIENKNINILEQVNTKINQYTDMMKTAQPQYQVEIQKNIQELTKIINIIVSGRDTSISNTIDFDGYRIDPKDKEELESLLLKHDIKYKLEKKNTTSEEIDKLKEMRAELTEGKNIEEISERSMR